MLTIHAFAEGDPILTGSLAMHRRGPERGRPVLSIQAVCVYCHDLHAVDLPDSIQLDGVFPLVAPCRKGAFVGRTIGMMVDPGRTPEARRQAIHFNQALRRWRVEQRLRHQLADQRGLDRRHRLDWPDSAARASAGP